MPVTKYDLNFLVNQYFVATLTQPKHPITPDTCGNFAYNCYSIIVGTPGGTNSYRELARYIQANADYYGINVSQAVAFLKNSPGFQAVFIQYIKDNYRIETNSEIIKRKIGEAARYIGEVAAGTIWGLIGPFIPIFGIGLAAIYLTNKAIKKPTA